MPSLLAGTAALLITTVSIVVTVLALDNATGGTLSPKMPAVYDLITSLPNARFTGYLNRVVDVYTLIRWALIAGCGLVTSLLKVCLTGFRDRVEQFYTFLRWASIAVYGLTTPILKACLAGFLARME